MVGVFLCLLLLLLNHESSTKLRKSMGTDKHGGYLQILEFLLLIENWMHGVSFTEEELNNTEICFPIFMDKYKSVIDRQSGHKMKVRRYQYIECKHITLKTYLCTNINTLLIVGYSL
jgi:hypothetical protein